MYKAFDTLEALYQEIQEDKNWTGAESALRNRYPLRFVLFEKFEDYYSFVQKCGDYNIFVQNIGRWLHAQEDDRLITYSHLASLFKDCVGQVGGADMLIAPFSEITRFYDNEKYKEFDALLQTIRLIEANENAQNQHQRIYVPIIGMQGKVHLWKNDPNIHIWEYRSTSEGRLYKLILTPKTYGVKELERKYVLCQTVKQWVNHWMVEPKDRHDIVCTSRTILKNARYAQPDNAFEYVVCENAYEFLTRGMHLDFGQIEMQPGEERYWEELAEQIDINDFDFEIFFNQRFNTFHLSDNHDFMLAWRDCKTDFDRWLLRVYTLLHFAPNDYLVKVLQRCQALNNSAFFSLVATQIFDETENEALLRQRNDLMMEATAAGISITELAEQQVRAKLSAIAADPTRGYYYAMKFMSPLTHSERALMIEWLGKGEIKREELKTLYPLLYHYTARFSLPLMGGEAWVNEYFQEYVRSKVANACSERLCQLLEVKNANEVTSEGWRNNFKTLKTLLHQREDIDLYYWIDGLGVDWVPFLVEIIKKHRMDGVYLNEIHVGIAELPTTTAVNRIKLEELAGDKLKKIGDLDHFAHEAKEYPVYIQEELCMMEREIDKVLTQYNGKKIAFVSDHGISYLSGCCSGLNLAGIEGHHGGRYATWEKGSANPDNNYVIQSDGQTICSLTHHSLTGKIPKGHGAHGGATPEELLVPVIIVSNQKNATNYSAQLLTYEVLMANPVVKYRIKGVNSVDAPYVIYNEVEYPLHCVGGNTFESEHLNLVGTASSVELVIGNFRQKDKITVRLGALEDDMFSF